ncbi:peptidyl-tRNA hydrolase, partial [Rhizodiscina lignyota]
LLICSIGNPISNPAYVNTLHSAGHTALVSLHQLLRGAGYDFTSFKGSAASRENASQRTGFAEEDWTFWMSSSLMNVSGKGVAEAYRKWKWDIAAEPDREAAARATLVVLHDEMEKPKGKIAVRKGSSSLKGHNGLKSIQQALGGQSFVRIGIGIDRPDSRDPEVVSRYVLRKMTRGEVSAVESTAPDILAALREIA